MSWKAPLTPPTQYHSNNDFKVTMVKLFNELKIMTDRPPTKKENMNMQYENTVIRSYWTEKLSMWTKELIRRSWQQTDRNWEVNQCAEGATNHKLRKEEPDTK